jgi:signal transduction histidine kinase
MGDLNMKAVVDKYKVLIFAPTGEDTVVLSKVLSKDGLSPFACENMEQLCNSIDEGAGTAIIAEEALFPLNIGRLIRTVQHQPEWSDFPIIIMARAGSDPDRAWALMTGSHQLLNVSVLERPVLVCTLLAAVRASLRSRDTQFRVEQELRRRTEVEVSLRAANEELQAFSYSISHDLRAPLSIMKGLTSLLIEDYNDKLDETGRDYLTRIMKSADQMSRLIEDMLSLSKISRKDMIMQNVDLSALSMAIVDELKKSQPHRQVDISIQSNLVARGDEKLLKIALTNLLSNAWKYTSKVLRPRIEMGHYIKDSKTVFFIRDNGAGFPMEHLSKLFKPFQRLHSEKEFTGTGIGLAIVQRVISRHGGRIWAEGEAGIGATFFFTLK